MLILKTILLFIFTAIAEILGCYLPYLWLNHGKSAWLLIPAGISLIIFAWLLTLHPTAAGRVYAAYGGIYVTIAIIWLWGIEKITPSIYDIVGSIITIIGMLVIIWGNRAT
ncbi:MAG: YnfA family protein [Neisseriaceae bacterium]